MADKGLFIAACHHIIAVILVPSSYSLQTKQLVTHKPDEQSRKHKLISSPLEPYWLGVQTTSYKNGKCGDFYQVVNLPEYEAEKIF